VSVRAALALALALAATPARAQQGYQLAWRVIAGGGTFGTTGGDLVLSGTIGQPTAGGPYAGPPYDMTAGFWAVTHGGVVLAQADLGITKTDGVRTAAPGQTLTYTIVAANAGPSAVTGASVVDAPPAALTGVTWTCAASAGSACPASGTATIDATVDLPAGGTATFTLTGTVAPTAAGSLVNTATVAPPAGVVDPTAADNAATDTDLLPAGPGPEGEIAHGLSLAGDLAAAGGPDVDLFRLHQEPFASYEVVVDASSGDFGAAGVTLERLATGASTVLQASAAVGTGAARSLRFRNDSSAAVDDQYVRVKSDPCGSGCGADDTYRLRAWETTATVPRFNNSSTQVTVLILQNRSADAVAGLVSFWDANGVLLHQQPLTLAPRAVAVANTAALPALAGRSGSITIAHDGAYGTLAGKAVALEPQTGFSFDSPLAVRPR
jgi:uncharacterized repeat protein (TIGR01451 family)